jgi:cell wall-associated NlpC family hydrolase
MFAALTAAGLPAADATRAVVLKPVANMYSKASEDADVVSQAIYGANVGVVERQSGWARIRTADDYTGWVPETALRLGQSYATSGSVAEVASLFAHIYREASVTKHAPLVTVPFESRLESVTPPAGEERWLQVRLPDDRSGWVQRGDVAFARRPLSIPEMLEFSKRFLGLPYTWGGTSSYGYDCSGFTQMLVRRAGVLMPRDAQPQADWDRMTKIERAQLQPGDLVYFGSSARKITHTGFYLGGGEFIHSTTNTHPVLQVSRLDDQPWTKLLVACRRWKQ